MKEIRGKTLKEWKEYCKSDDVPIKTMKYITCLEERIETLTISVVNNWVEVKDSMPENSDQVFVKYENGKYGINEWWESDNCWKYQFDNMIIKEWCKPPCS